MKMIRGCSIMLVHLIVLLLLCRCTSANRDDKEHNVANEATMQLGDVVLYNLAGQRIDMAEFKNKKVFINFWATWCKPCIQEMPTIKSAQEIIKNENIVFLFASMEDADRIEKFSAAKGFPFRYVQVQNMEDLNIPAIPATFIFDEQGKLFFSEIGYRSWDTPENIALINNKSTP